MKHFYRIFTSIFLLGLAEDETKLVLHLPSNRQPDFVRWNPANQDEVWIQQHFYSLSTCMHMIDHR